MSKDRQTPVGLVADTVSNNWVNKKAPSWSQPYLRLSRVDRPIGTWLLLLPCWWGALLASTADSLGFQLLDLWIVVGCGIGAILMRGAGCTWNDIVDKDIDFKVERTRHRPLPAKQINISSAYIWLFMQLLLAFFILISFNKVAILVGLLSIIPVIIYPFAKRFTWWPQIFLGIAFNWGALLSWSAHTGSIDSPAIFLYLSGIFWTLFYDTIYAHQDTDDDALIGIKSTAIFFGANSIKWLITFIILTMSFYIIAVLDALFFINNSSKVIICIVGIIGFGIHLVWQVSKLDIRDWVSCLKIFRSNRNAGFIPIIFLVASLFL